MVRLNLTPASQRRVERFVDWFIRSEFVESWINGETNNWISNPERAQRCREAAEHGEDGSTHQEIINDWRNAFYYWVNYKRKESTRGHVTDRIETAAYAHFDHLEAWHERNGTLNDRYDPIQGDEEDEGVEDV